jgi:hypothetical protein
MATFANSTERNFSLKFRPSGETGLGQNYIWDYSGMVEARAGPDRQETEVLMEQDGQSETLMNQCLFIRTLNATLRDDTWQKLGFDFGTTMDVQYDTYPNHYIPTSTSPPATSTPTCPSCNSMNGGYVRPAHVPTHSPVHIANFNTALVGHIQSTS